LDDHDLSLGYASSQELHYTKPNISTDDSVHELSPVTPELTIQNFQSYDYRVH